MASNTTFVSGAIFTAQQANNFPWGVQAYSKRTAGSTTVTTSVTDIAGATGTFTAVTGRAYKVSFMGNLSLSTGQVMYLRLYSGASAIYESLFTGLGGYTIAGPTYIVTGLTAGSNTLKMVGQTDTGTVTVLGTSGNPASFIIEDIGIA
jgi:hypothetical protein